MLRAFAAVRVYRTAQVTGRKTLVDAADSFGKWRVLGAIKALGGWSSDELGVIPPLPIGCQVSLRPLKLVLVAVSLTAVVRGIQTAAGVARAELAAVASIVGEDAAGQVLRSAEGWDSELMGTNPLTRLGKLN
jgi:hypothetical protein